DNLQEQWYPTHNTNPLLELLLGIGLGALGMILVWTAEQFSESMRELRKLLQNVLVFEDVRWSHAVSFGLLAGIPEEILFRGAIQPELGLILTSILFGVLHAASRTYAIYAIIAGFYLGAIAAWRGDLWAATAAHFFYDAGMFLML